MITRTLIRALGLVAVTCLAACSGRGGDDPYEPLNRKVHTFNVGLDANVVSPLTRPLRRGGDKATTPGALSLTDGLTNAGSNLSLPGKAVNGLLQGRPGVAVRNGARFIVNTTLGVGGLLDPAGQEFALAEVDTDFGQTLQIWGVPEGAYLELPVLGPSSERDAAGKIVDWFINPLKYWLHGDARTAATVVRVVGKAGERAKYGDTLDSVLHDSADSYTQTKLLYQQHRRHELGEEAEAIDPYAE